MCTSDHGHDHHDHSDHGHDHHDHDHHSNPRDAYQEKQVKNKNIAIKLAIVHLLGDILQSLGVIVAALLIYWQPFDIGTTSNGLPLWVYVDPLTTFVFSIAVIGTTIPTVKQCVQILMQTVPVNVDGDELVQKMMEIEGVCEIHDMHVWSLGSSFVISSNPKN